MKKIYSLLLISLFFLTLPAQAEWTINVRNHGTQGGYIETLDGKPTPLPYNNVWPKEGYSPAWYIFFPKGTFNVKSQNIGVIDVTKVDPKEELLKGVSPKDFEITVKSEGWVRFALREGSQNSGLYNFTINSNNAEGDKIYLAAWRSIPSLHLNTFGSTDINCPKTECFDWIYDEVMIPKEADFIGTYVESFGFKGGYIGIQNNGPKRHDIIFSVWDNGDTDSDPELAGFKRSGIITHADDPHVVAERFGGEGTGNHIIIQGDQWRPDQWVRFLINVRPEQIRINVQEANGQEKTINYNNSIISAWYKAEGVDDKWHFIGCLRQSGTNHFFGHGFNSFLEEYTRGNTSQGDAFHIGYYRRVFTRDMLSGTWFNRNNFTFGHTDGGTEPGSRNDRYQTALNDVQGEPAILMRSGGFTNPYEGPGLLPLKDPKGIVPTSFQLDSLYNARIRPAIQIQDEQRMETNINSAMISENMKNWVIESKSSEETSGEGANGRAAQTIDGKTSTYWHTQWQGASPDYPHYLVLKAKDNKAHEISAINIVENRTGYRAGNISVSVSNEDRRFITILDHVKVPDQANVILKLPQETLAKRIKITFNKPAPNNKKFLVVNEISFTSFSIARLKNIAQFYLDNADQFNSYPSEELENLREVMSSNNIDQATLTKALQELAKNGTLIKRNNLIGLEQISSECAYTLSCPSGYGTLTANDKGELTMCNTDPNCGLQVAPEALRPCDVLSPYSNWMVLPINNPRFKNYRYLYNIGADKFLCIERQPKLQDEPSPMMVTSTTNGFRLNKGRNNIALNPSNNTVVGNSRPYKGSIFSFYDNFTLTPTLEQVNKVKEKI